MNYRRLGTWGIKLSELGFGSWLTFNNGDQDLADRLHRTAYECGINFFDTANAYGRGSTEVLVGKALTPFRRAHVRPGHEALLALRGRLALPRRQ